MKKYNKTKILGFIVIFLVIILLSTLIGYKVILINNYKESVESLKFIDVLNKAEFKKINTIKIDTNEYFEYKNIKFQNHLQNFLQKEENDVVYYELINDEQKTTAYFSLGIEEDYINKINDDTDFDLYTNILGKTKVSKINANEYFTRIKINNTLDLFDYLIENKDNNLNIFNSIKSIKEETWINEFVNTVYSGDTITFLENDLEGYILEYKNNENFKSIVIFDENKMYGLNFWGLDYFNETTINDILNTLIIK